MFCKRKKVQTCVDVQRLATYQRRRQTNSRFMNIVVKYLLAYFGKVYSISCQKLVMWIIRMIWLTLEALFCAK